MKKIFLFLAGVFSGTVIGRVFIKKKYESYIREELLRSEKLQEFYDLLLLWLELRQMGGTLQNYFEKNNIRNVAVYGMKELGEALCRELDYIGIEIRYLIDKNPETIYSEKEIYSPDDCLPETDMVIVTALHYYNEIEENMSSKVNCPIVNLTDMVYEALTYTIMGNSRYEGYGDD